MATLRAAVDRIDADATLLHRKSGTTGSILIRRRPSGHAEDIIEVRVACAGNVDAGKSTLLGVLTSGDLDDGRGHARQNLFKHKHELDSGRTSSVGVEIMGFDSKGEQIVKSESGRKLNWEGVSERSSKVLTFLDLAGHEKYLKTTVYGMTGWAPDYVMLIVRCLSSLQGFISILDWV